MNYDLSFVVTTIRVTR